MLDAILICAIGVVLIVVEVGLIKIIKDVERGDE